MGDPVTIVVFGSTGDLMRRKLVPALIDLWKQGILHESCLIVGVGRRPFDDSGFQGFLAEALDAEAQEILPQLPIRYFTGDITRVEGLAGLAAFLKQHEPKECMGRLFYLATSYTFFPTIVSGIAREGLHELRCGWTRVAFEKPFGHSLASAGELEQGVRQVFPEGAVYRIDHYLAKEGARLFLAAKESCPSLRRILSRAYVSSVKVRADESLGVGERIAYYQESGALKDMVQSHLLQLIALVLSEPATWTASALHRERVRVLQSLRVEQPGEHLLGQYRSYGAEAVKHQVARTSTETYARIRLQSMLPSWSGVPLTLQTGKKMPKKRTEITIYFRTGTESSAYLRVCLHPAPLLQMACEGAVSPLFQAAQEELGAFVRTFPHAMLHDDGYSFLLAQALAGDERWFVQPREIEACWLLIESLASIRPSIRFVEYADGSDPESLAQKASSTERIK